MKFSVLVVEDDHATAVLLEAIFSHYSIACTVATHGREAIRLLHREHFDAVVLDLLMPEMDGFELLRHLENQKPAILPAVIVVTAAAPRTFEGRDELRSVRCVLRKPIDLPELIGHVRGCAPMAGASQASA